MQEHTLTVPMISDWDHEIIRMYDVVRDDLYRMVGAAHRSIFVLDTSGTVTYTWVREGNNPDFKALISEIRAAVAKATGT